MKLQHIITLSCTMIAASALLLGDIASQEAAHSDAIETQDEAAPTDRLPVGDRAEPQEVRDAQREAIDTQLTNDYIQLVATKGKAPVHLAKSLVVARAAKYPKHSDSIVFYKDLSSPIGWFEDYIIKLEDYSEWKMTYFDGVRINDWSCSDQLVITRNLDKFTNNKYEYRIINQNTGVNVPVHLYLRPLYDGSKTKWITYIEHKDLLHSSRGKDLVYLSDGTVFNSSMYDVDVTGEWRIDDIVIIGVNNNESRGNNPNILINVNTLTTAMGNFN